MKHGEATKEDNDRIETGYLINPYGVKFNLAGVFLLWKGASIVPHNIEDYEQSVINFIKLPGNFVCT